MVKRKAVRKIKKAKFTTMICEDLLRGIKIQAIKEGRTVSEILNELIKEYLREKGAV